MSGHIHMYEMIGKKNIIPAIIIVVVVFLAVVFKPFTVVPAGHRGVVFNQFKGVDRSRILGEGMHFITPYVESVIRVEVRVQKQEIEASAASRDLQEVKVKLAVNYHLDPAKVAEIYSNVGTDLEGKLISPGVQESVKAITAQYNATQLIANRPEVKEKVLKHLQSRLRNYNIIVNDVSITDFQFSSEFMKSIETKQIAEQEALKKQYELQKAEQEASIEVAKAEGERKATIARAQGQAEAQRLLRASVSAEIIKLKMIEAQMEAIKKWDGKMPSVTGGSLPMFDVNSMIGK